MPRTLYESSISSILQLLKLRNQISVVDVSVIEQLDTIF